MTIAEKLAARATENAEPLGVPLVHGQWFPIRLVPDTVTGDRFNVGVAFVDRAGVARCRMLDDLARLRCLYGDKVDVESFSDLCEIVEADLAGAIWSPDNPSLSDNIQFGAPLHAAGFSVDEILEHHFTAMVPFGASHKANAGAAPISTDVLKAQILRDLRKRYAKEVGSLLDGGAIRLPASYGRGRQLTLPLHDATTGQAGDIVSAFTARQHTIAGALNHSMVDFLSLRLAEQNRKPQRDLRMFVLEPGKADFVGRDLIAVHATVDAIAALAKGADVHVERHHDKQALADSIVAWRRAA